MITIKKYNKSYAEKWDNFISISNNGTIFQTRKFLGYHITRKFKDYSLIITKNTTIIAVIPGVKIQDNKIYYSHPGTSYGGLVIKREISFERIHQIIESLDIYLIKHKFKQIYLINSPSVYWKDEEQSLDYLLQWNKYQIKEIYISHVSNIAHCKTVESLLSKRKRRYIVNDSQLNNFTFKKIKNHNELIELYALLEKTKKKFNTTPTHSIEELSQLYSLFPDDIVIYISRWEGNIVGGFVIFHTTTKTSLIFYNIIDEKMTESQLSVLQLYNCMKICKKRGSYVVDFGVSHTPEQTNPLDPKFSLIQFKEQFGARGIMRIAYQKELH